jgi:hypothetical protein
VPQCKMSKLVYRRHHLKPNGNGGRGYEAIRKEPSRERSIQMASEESGHKMISGCDL